MAFCKQQGETKHTNGVYFILFFLFIKMLMMLAASLNSKQLLMLNVPKNDPNKTFLNIQHKFHGCKTRSLKKRKKAS